MDIVGNAKRLVGDDGFLADIYRHFHVNHTYGYIYSEKQVGRFLSVLRKGLLNYNYDPTKKDYFVFIGDKNLTSTMRVAVFGDIDEGNVNEHDCVFYTTHVLKDESHARLHDLYWRLNKKLPLPGKCVWEKRYTTDNFELPVDKNVFIIFLAGAYFEESFSQPKLMNKLFTTPEGSFCRRLLYLSDPIDKFPNIKRWMPLFDEILTYSREDALKYGAHYVCTPCVKLNEQINEPLYDIQVRLQDVNNDDRAVLVRELYEYLTTKGVTCNFVVNTDKVPDSSRGGVAYSRHRIPYREMVQEELRSNVLLEIISPKTGNAATLRYREAVMYGKKLLTNNPRIASEGYSASNDIRYFAKPEDIDIAWLLDRTPVSHGYQGEYSTDAFLKKVRDISISSEGVAAAAEPVELLDS